LAISIFCALYLSGVGERQRLCLSGQLRAERFPSQEILDYVVVTFVV